MAYLIVFRKSDGGAAQSVAPPALSGAGGPAASSGASEDDSKLVPLSLYFGSQTGTAEAFAKQLEGEARAHGFKGHVLDLESFDAESLQSGMAVFLVATYGEGDPTDNAVDFTRWLTEEAAGGLEGLKFAVFGLGNRQYEHYNKMSRVVDGRLEALGAERVYRRGEGDDDGTLDEDWEEWRADLWAALAEAAGVVGDGGAADPSGLPPLPEFKYELTELGLGGPAGAAGGVAPRARALSASELWAVDKSCRAYFEAVPVRVSTNRQLRQAPSHGSATVHVSLDLRGSGLTYGTADNLGVLPVNATGGVLDLAEWCGWDAHAWIDLAPTPGAAGAGPLFPTPCTVGHALAHYCDIHGPVSKALVGALAHYAGKESEKAALAALLARDAKAAYHAAIVEPQLSVAEFLGAYPSVRPPLGVFLQLVPRLQPRLYTIASSAAVQPQDVDIAVSLIAGAKPGRGDRVHTGVASSYIASSGADTPAEHLAAMGLAPGRYVGEGLDTLSVVVRASTFNLPRDPATPIIMVGPGTGLAPMRAFLQERAAAAAGGAALGDALLFFGCRRPDEDYIYADELAGWVADGTLSALHTAFSRAQDKKVYVQHRIAEQGAEVWRLLAAGARVYVCGATTMGQDVAAALRGVAIAHGAVAPDDAQAWFDGLHKDGRYVSELWSA